MKSNKISNFILEISQVLLVFLGMYSSIMCAALRLGLPLQRGILALVIQVAAFLFYGLFTVLETFRRGKLYGMLGLTAFFTIFGYCGSFSSSYYGSGAQRFCSICQTIISIAKIIVFAVFIIMALCEKTVKVEIKDAPKEETIDKE